MLFGGHAIDDLEESISIGRRRQQLDQFLHSDPVNTVRSTANSTSPTTIVPVKLGHEGGSIDGTRFAVLNGCLVVPEEIGQIGLGLATGFFPDPVSVLLLGSNSSSPLLPPFPTTRSKIKDGGVISGVVYSIFSDSRRRVWSISMLAILAGFVPTIT